MATTDTEERVGEHAGQEVSVGGKLPTTPPLSTDPLCLDVVGSNNVTFQPYDQVFEAPHLKRIDLVHMKMDSPAMEEDHMQTPKLEHPPLVIESLVSRLSQPEKNEHQQQCQGNGEEDVIISGHPDYFTQNVPQDSFVADISRTPSSSNVSSTGLSGSSNSQLDSSSTPVSPDSRVSAWKDYMPSFNPESNRPVSVPNFQSKTLSRRRDGPDYPNYPDQSFKALQNQHYPPPYQPSEPQHLRTRSSHPAQNLSFSSSDEKPARGYPQIPSGAKTAGNTPAQSPGLFTPMLSKKHWTGESDETRSGTPMLHPAHLQAPKETHKLLKDIDPISGRKTINHYELLEKLGSGNHGTVKLARDLVTDTLCAVKIVRRFSKKLRLGRSGDPNDMIKKEVAILKKARHPNVVSLLEVIDDDEWGKVYLALEYVERGEIVWRKPTDKDVALFEMERCERELANGLSDDHERAAIEEFNRLAPSRRHEKAQRLADQERRDKERSGCGGAHREARNPGFDPYFSLEYGGASEDEAGAEPIGQFAAQIQGKKQPTNEPMPVDSTEGLPQSETPIHTPKPVSYSLDTTSTPASASSSRPETPAQYGGPTSGLEVKETAKDVELQSLLNKIILGQQDWNGIDENFRYVPCLTLAQALDAFRDTVLGLEYLHYQGIIHRDIKPANLLWTTGFRVKISDFGVSYLGKPIREDDNNEEIAEADAEVHDEAIELAKTVGTPAFYAPELCDPHYFEVGGDSDRPAITGQIDVWALGVTLYAMVFGRLPFFDGNQFLMYEKIARNEVFIPRMRLKGVSHEIASKAFGTVTDRRKRFDDILEYEAVNDELRDLLKRLLEKKPSKRITLKEVKHHPWVLQGITDRTLWIDETDPSLQSEGKKIEVSTQEVQDSVTPLTVFDRVKAGFQRVGSVLRGRGSQHRKRTNSNTKAPDGAGSTGATRNSQSVKDERRPSLRGDEQILPALRASRETSEHPLAQSVAASPELKDNHSCFDDSGNAVRPASDPQANRPVLTDRTLSTADSMKTIRAPVPALLREASSPNTSSPNEDFSSATTTVVDPTSNSSSSLSNVFSGAGRRFVDSMRTRERGVRRQSPSRSSRSSSIGDSTEDFHASPSLALSSAIAAGHVDQPPALREGPDAHPVLQDSPSEAFRRAQEQNYRRQTFEHAQRRSRPPTVSMGTDVACPPSPDDEIFLPQFRPTSAADITSAFVISSSSDQIGSGESMAHSRVPSVVSGASSLSVPFEEDEETRAHVLEKSISPLTIGRRSGSHHRGTESETPRLTPSIARAAAERAAADEDDAGYNGEGEQDSDSEDEGLAMA
ncbi:hypothetical protein HO173_003729 [Letharia columbiana]|uniref:non-specific serine/threonine protein kinase n=1 Tax=Letharia columbiana TaxID=112416 RepID=A0A8H6L782_9LECA|nr:uncharacterized protein HO173_003729 [Letharia columbiana]KAF6238095.1 hypothetical protein HO173_003729 [Letharia columbiana]